MATSMQNMSDADFLALLNAMIATISANLANYPGITAAMMTAFGTMRDDYSDELNSHNMARDAARAARVDKAEDEARRLRDLMKANGVSEANFAATGIPSGAGPEGLSPSGVTMPVATVDTSERLRHTINFADSAAPNNKRRPKGVVGCEIWVKIDGPPPGDEKDCVFLALDSGTPYVAEFGPEHAGKTAHYLLRWQLKDGSRTAFGETVSATITG